MTEHIPNYEKANDVFPILEEYVDVAVRRAKQLEEYHLKNGNMLPLGITVNPYTEVYHLIEAIVS